jgi:hypothetical protein
MSPGVNFEAIGNLVKTWVLGEDRLRIPDPSNPKDYLAWPKPVSTKDPAAIQALRDQFAAAGTRYVIPAAVTEVQVVQSSDTCFALKLPAAQAIQSFEAKLAAAQDYPVPPFYASAVGSPPTTIAQKLRLDAARIGDYTISNCAGGG